MKSAVQVLQLPFKSGTNFSACITTLNLKYHETKGTKGCYQDEK